MVEFRVAGWLWLWLGVRSLGAGELSTIDPEGPPHRYQAHSPQDVFTRRQADFLSGREPLDRTNERAFLTSLLKALEVAPSSQLLVFSTTSLQLSLISPSNPRALYFNEDVYLGYVPGGRIEIVAIDPEMGGIFYIFDIPRGDRPLSFERSDRCMNCHARDDTGFIPGLVAKSVVPGPGGGSLTAYRVGRTGHEIPLADRFGGWHVTGADGFTKHWGNLTGSLASGKLTTVPNLPGQRFDLRKYPAETSDALVHLLHEHQVGFVNRAVELTYRAREFFGLGGSGSLTPEQSTVLNELVRGLVKYLLFADEAALPKGGISGDPVARADFLHNRRASASGRSLKDLELTNHLFRYRCSYMIYSAAFVGIPKSVKQQIYQELQRALSVAADVPEYRYLPAAEKLAVLEILRATLPEFPR